MMQQWASQEYNYTYQWEVLDAMDMLIKNETTGQTLPSEDLIFDPIGNR